MLPLLNEYYDIEIVAITSSNFNTDESKKSGLKHIINFVISNITSSLFRGPRKEKNIRIIHYPIPENRITAPFGHLFQSIAIAWILKYRKMGKGFDVCLASPSPAGFPALLAKLGIPVIYEDVDRFEYFVNNNLRKKITNFMESYCIRNSAVVISAGYNLASSAKRIRKGPVETVPNGVDFPNFYKATINLKNNRSDIVYLGTLSEWSGLEVVLQSMPYIVRKNPAIKLYLIGSGEKHFIKKLHKLCFQLNISNNVIFMGKRKHSDLPDILSKLLIGVATFPDNELMRYAFPLKLVEYMAAGLCVIATDVGDTGFIVREASCGVLVKNDPISISSSICSILENLDYANLLANNGQRWVKTLDLRVLAKKEADILLKSIK